MPEVTQSDVLVYSRGDLRTIVYRILKTGTLFASWICLGLFNEVVGPTLPDLKARVSGNYEEISRVLSARSAGLFLGSISGGFLYDRFTLRRDMLLSIALVISGLTIASAPWCSELWTLGVLFHLMGHGHALLTTGGNPSIAFLWADKAAGPYNFLHSGFGLGAAIGPLISHPFLSSLDVSNNSNSSINFETANTSSLSNLSKIEYPYMIAGASCFLVALIFLSFYLTTERAPTIFIPKEQHSVREIFNPARCTGGESSFGIQMLCIVFFYYMFVVGSERAYGKFVFSFARESNLRFTTTQAAWLNSVYWISFTVARFVAFIVANWVPIHIMLYVQVAGTIASAILLNVFHDNTTMFWVFTSSFGFFKSPLFPSFLGMANRYMEISSMTVMCVNIGSAIGGMLVQWLTGYMFEYYGPTSFLYILAACSSMIGLVYVTMHLVARRHGERYDSHVKNQGNNGFYEVSEVTASMDCMVSEVPTKTESISDNKTAL